MRALIAEENFISRAYLHTIFERNGFSVDEVHDELGAASLLTKPCGCGLVILSVTASIEPSALIYRSLEQLHPFDVLGAALEAGHERTLLREGIMLDELYISKIKTHAAMREMRARVPVFRPPGETLLFLNR